MAEDNARRVLHIRVDARQHDRLHELARHSRTAVAEVVRELLERALDPSANVELLTRTRVISNHLTALERQLGRALPTLHERLGTVEQLVCTIDANAVRRGEIEHQKHRKWWSATRYGIWELQRVMIHVLEYALRTDGHSREVARKLHADCVDASEQDFRAFLAMIDAENTALDAAAPPAVQPPPAPQIQPFTSTPPASDDITLGRMPRGHEHGDADQPSLFEPADLSPPPSRNGINAASHDPVSNSANGAGHGGGEIVP